MAARRRTKKQEIRDDAELAKQRALEGIPGLLMKLNLAPQTCSLRVYEGREIPTTALVEPFGATVTPPAEAMQVGRILMHAFSEEQLTFFLSNAVTLNHGPRWVPRSFAGGYNYFFSLSRHTAVQPRLSEGTRGCWAAIALGCRSLLRWTGGVLHLDGSDLLDPKWKEYFRADVAAIAADLEDGAIEPGSPRLASTLRQLASKGPRKRAGRRPSQSSHRHMVEIVLRHRRGQRVEFAWIIDEVRKHFGISLSTDQVRQAVRRIEGVESGAEPRRWARLI